MVTKSQINVRLPDGVIEALKAKAEEQGVSLTAVITTAIKRDLGLEDPAIPTAIALESRVQELEAQMTSQKKFLQTLKSLVGTKGLPEAEAS